jgi:hypothetical protein
MARLHQVLATCYYVTDTSVKLRLDLHLEMKEQCIKIKESELRAIIGQIDEIRKKLHELKK